MAATSLRVPGTDVLGRIERRALGAIGWAGDRVPALYEADARLNRRRLGRMLSDCATSSDGLLLAERSIRSQNGEDGVIAEIFARIGTTDRRFVEIGASDGQENCTRALVDDGWTGIWVEADPARASAARSVGGDAVTVVDRPAMRGDAAQLLWAAGAGREFDLLVVDIDSDDLGVLCGVLSEFRPRVVVAEYNSAFSPRAAWSSPPDVSGWDGTFRHGASLKALAEAANGSDYDLVACESTGVNAFFVRRDVNRGRLPARSSAEAWRPPAFSANPVGHPRSAAAMTPCRPLTVDELRVITLERLSVPPTVGRGPWTCLPVAVTVVNGSDATLTSGPPNAVNVSLRWFSGDDVRGDTPRSPLPVPVPPRSSRRLQLWMRPPPSPGPASLRATLVQEGVFWREHIGGRGSALDAEVLVG
jgi:hypothetical protein